MASGFVNLHRSKALIVWLGFMIFLVALMIVVGGATRLTNSGLSITEWKPITGALPPMSRADWIAEFEKYKQVPEFMLEHSDMTLKEFEFIYFWEWGHRQLGRFIGLAYALPFLWFLIRTKIPQGKTLGFWTVLLLIGLQGAIGWWMVASGLESDRASVAPYRLATHLGMAFIILGILVWMFLDALKDWPRKASEAVHRRAALLVGFIFLQIVSGAFVAGLRAGKTYNTWPLMDGDFVPKGYGSLSPFWHNFAENIAAAQFNHRLLAYIVLALSVIVYLSSRKHFTRFATRRVSLLLLVIVLWQVGLGIWTLLSAAPLNLSLIHQGSGIILFIVAVWTLWTTRLAEY